VSSDGFQVDRVVVVVIRLVIVSGSLFRVVVVTTKLVALQLLMRVVKTSLVKIHPARLVMMLGTLMVERKGLCRVVVVTVDDDDSSRKPEIVKACCSLEDGSLADLAVVSCFVGFFYFNKWMQTLCRFFWG
jgi:hypothetical protein